MGWFRGKKKKKKEARQFSAENTRTDMFGWWRLPSSLEVWWTNLRLSDANWISHLGNTPPIHTHTRTCKGLIFQQIFCSLKTPQLFPCQPFCIPQPCCMKIRGRCAYARGPGALSATAEAPRSPPAPCEISPAERRALLSSKRRNNRPVMTEVW